MADDLDGPRAEQYGYVNRVIADDQLDDEVDAIAARLARFEHEPLARTKAYVDQVTLPPDSEFPPALADFFELFGGPRSRRGRRGSRSSGSNVDSDSRAISRSSGRGGAPGPLSSGGRQLGFRAGQRADELPARADPELREDLPQMPFDGARAQEQPRADLRVREPVAREPCDLPLLRA